LRRRRDFSFPFRRHIGLRFSLVDAGEDGDAFDVKLNGHCWHVPAHGLGMSLIGFSFVVGPKAVQLNLD